MEISPLCFGCESLGGTDWGAVNVLDIETAVVRSLELGVNFFYTAAVYGLGLSEERLGRVLGAYRHEVIVATKGGLSWSLSSSGNRAKVFRNGSASAIRLDVESSLRRLGLDVIPLYYVHWPDEKTPFQETFQALTELKEEGKVGAIGCSNFNLPQLQEALRYAKIEHLQISLNILQAEIHSSLKEFCKKQGISIIAYNVLAHGLLTGKYDLKSKFPDNDRRSRLGLFQGESFVEALKSTEIICKHAEDSGLTPASYAIRWALQQEMVVSVITGIKTVEQLEENWMATKELKK